MDLAKPANAKFVVAMNELARKYGDQVVLKGVLEQWGERKCREDNAPPEKTIEGRCSASIENAGEKWQGSLLGGFTIRLAVMDS